MRMKPCLFHSVRLLESKNGRNLLNFRWHQMEILLFGGVTNGRLDKKSDTAWTAQNDKYNHSSSIAQKYGQTSLW